MITREDVTKAFDALDGVSFHSDCQRIVDAVADRFGIEITLEEAKRFWKDYSDDYYSAGWVGMDNFEDITLALEFEHYIRRINRKEELKNG